MSELQHQERRSSSPRRGRAESSAESRREPSPRPRREPSNSPLHESSNNQNLPSSTQTNLRRSNSLLNIPAYPPQETSKTHESSSDNELTNVAQQSGSAVQGSQSQHDTTLHSFTDDIDKVTKQVRNISITGDKKEEDKQPEVAASEGNQDGYEADQESLPPRQKDSRYNKAEYQNSSKFRHIRNRRRDLAGMTGKKANINLMTAKYKGEDQRSHYITTRSVPNTSKKDFNLDPGHSEERYKGLRDQFEEKHNLKPEHLEWVASEREPCGEGPGLNNCRSTLQGMQIPDNKIYFASEYPDGKDMKENSKEEKPASLNKKATARRKLHQSEFNKKILDLRNARYSENESEDPSNYTHEYESDFGEKSQKRMKKPYNPIGERLG